MHSSCPANSPRHAGIFVFMKTLIQLPTSHQFAMVPHKYEVDNIVQSPVPAHRMISSSSHRTTPPPTRGKQKQECKAQLVQYFCLVLTGKHEESSVNVHQNANAMQHQTSIITQPHSSMKKDFKPLESKRLSKIYFLKM